MCIQEVFWQDLVMEIWTSTFSTIFDAYFKAFYTFWLQNIPLWLTTWIKNTIRQIDNKAVSQTNLIPLSHKRSKQANDRKR